MRMILGNAVSKNSDTGYPENARHPFLAFVAADEDQAGIDICTAELSELGWGRPEYNKIGTVDVDSPKRKDPTIEEARSHAQDMGFSVVIYSDPVIETGVETGS